MDHKNIMDKLHKEAVDAANINDNSGSLNFMIGFLESRAASLVIEIERLNTIIKLNQNKIMDLENKRIHPVELHYMDGLDSNQKETETWIIPKVAWFQFCIMPDNKSRLVIGEVEEDQVRMRRLLTIYSKDEHDIRFIRKIYNIVKQNGIKVK